MTHEFLVTLFFSITLLGVGIGGAFIPFIGGGMGAGIVVDWILSLFFLVITVLGQLIIWKSP